MPHCADSRAEERVMACFRQKKPPEQARHSVSTHMVHIRPGRPDRLRVRRRCPTAVGTL
jgi:hypothetical protein